MADFDKLREAAEEIKLDDLQRQRILEACKGKKRRKVNYAAIASVAALFVITVAVFSPGFLMRAGMADKAANEAAVEDCFFADQETPDENGLFSDKAFSANGDADLECTVDEYTQCIFDAEGFRSIYSAIPQSFVSLVGYNAFNEWAATAESSGGMAIIQFVEHFGISKEAFDEANRSYAKYIYNIYGTFPLYKASYPEHEKYEIFDTEMIYSSDRETVEEYYKAIEIKGTGAHSMPAEIIVPEEYYK